MNEIDLTFMPQKTKFIFETLAKTNFIQNYTLVGGTALSIQIKHRLSEDLDFIFDGEKLSTNTIKRNINKLFSDYKIIRQNYTDQIDFVIQNIKITFFCSDAVAIPFSVKDNSFSYKKINIATIDTIAALKFSTIAQRNTIRDYYDLYYIAKYHTALRTMINKTKKLIPNLSPVTYTETLVYTADIPENDLSNHLQPVENINKQAIAKFFTDELKKIIEEV